MPLIQWRARKAAKFSGSKMASILTSFLTGESRWCWSKGVFGLPARRLSADANESGACTSDRVCLARKAWGYRLRSLGGVERP
jgi:hypothetical protein